MRVQSSAPKADKIHYLETDWSLKNWRKDSCYKRKKSADGSTSALKTEIGGISLSEGVNFKRKNLCLYF